MQKLWEVCDEYFYNRKEKQRVRIDKIKYLLNNDKEIFQYINDFLYDKEYDIFKKLYIMFFGLLNIPVCNVCEKELTFSFRYGFSVCRFHYFQNRYPYNIHPHSYIELLNISEFRKINLKVFIQKKDVLNCLNDFRNDFKQFNSYCNYDLLLLFSFIQNIDFLKNIKKCQYCNDNVIFSKKDLIENDILKFRNMCKKHIGSEIAIISLESFKKNNNGLNPSQLDKVKEKKRQTFIKNYGVDTIFQNEEFKKQCKKNYLKKHGVENPSQLEEVKKKKEKTFIKHYGVKTSFQNKEFIDHLKKNHLKKHGVENPSQLDKVKEKKRQTFIKNYGVDNIFKTEEFIEKSEQTCLKKYGKKNYSQSKEGRELSRKNAIKYVEKQKLNNEPLCPCIGEEERKCLNYLQENIKYKILRNQRYIGYFIDGYIKELNIAIEFDEDQHFNEYGLLQERDLIRENDIIKKLNCSFFRINKNDWLRDKEKIVHNFKFFLKRGINIGYENKENRLLKW